MRLLVAITLVATLFPSALIAQQYYLVNNDPRSAIFIDQDTVRWRGSNTTANSMIVFRVPRTFGEYFIQAVETEIEFDCRQALFRSKETSVLSANGDLVAGPIEALTDWKVIAPLSSHAVMADLACRNIVPPRSPPMRFERSVIITSVLRTNENIEVNAAE